MSELICFGKNYKPNIAPSHDKVRQAVGVIRQHLEAEWISDGCKADHAFGCASCQAVLLLKELDGVLYWLDDEQDNRTPLADRYADFKRRLNEAMR